VTVQEVRWDEGCSQSADNCTFFNGSGNANHHFGTAVFVHQSIISAVKEGKIYNTNRSVWYCCPECACSIL